MNYVSYFPARRIYKSRWFAFKRLHFLLNEDELRYIDTINTKNVSI